MAESNRTKWIMMEVCKNNATTVFRNNTGKAWQGEYFRTKTNDVLLKNPRIIEFGLCEGSSDVIGWTERIITPEMVGKKVAVFTAIEVKEPNGRTSAAQLNFINQIRKCGGIAGIAVTPEEAKNFIETM